jgi:hypothetical protein
LTYLLRPKNFSIKANVLAYETPIEKSITKKVIITATVLGNAPYAEVIATAIKSAAERIQNPETAIVNAMRPEAAFTASAILSAFVSLLSISSA